MFAAIAKAIHKIAKCNLHSEMGGLTQWAEKLARQDSVSTVLIVNFHNWNKSFI
jgi:hypothetical protein